MLYGCLPPARRLFPLLHVLSAHGRIFHEDNVLGAPQGFIVMIGKSLNMGFDSSRHYGGVCG